MKEQLFYSNIGEQIKQYLTLHSSLGFVYENYSHPLKAFDRHLVKHFPDCQTITKHMIVSYLNTMRHTSTTRTMHVSILRQLCRFMFQFDTNTYIPEKGLVDAGLVQIKPHIFTEEEILKIIHQTNNIYKKHKLLPKTYTIIIGLLWVTGMRIGEIVNLKIEDVDTDEGIIYVRQTKFFKSRLIPLSISSTQELLEYKHQRRSFGYSEATGTPFFYNNQRSPCVRGITSATIRQFMINAGIKTIQGKTPRVHDIRHSFATRWLIDLYKSGKDPTTYLAALATYIGHASIANTMIYLHPSLELLNIASNKVHTYILSTGENNLMQLVQSFFQEYLTVHRGLSQNTIMAYRDALKLFFLHESSRQNKQVARLSLDDINAEAVLMFLSQIETKRNNGIITRNLRLAALRAFCLFLTTKDTLRMGEYQKIIAIPKKRCPRKVIGYLEVNEVQSILKSIDCTDVAGQSASNISE